MIKILKITALILVGIALVPAVPVKAAVANVAILPAVITIPSIGTAATADLNISDVKLLFAYEIMIWYDRTILNATSVVRPPGHFLEPIKDQSNEYVVKWIINNDYNATHGQIWLSYMLLAPEEGRNGTGILARITFNGTAAGSSAIVLNDYPGELGPVRLVDSISAAAIPHTATDGTIAVAPEFPIGLLLPFLAATAVAALFTVLRKRKPTSQNQ